MRNALDQRQQMKHSLCLLALVMAISACVQSSNMKTERSDSRVSELIDYEPAMLAPGIISKATFEGHASVTPDGKEVFFVIYSNDHQFSTIVYSTKTTGTWSEPEIVSFSGEYRDGSPALSPDGRTLYFSSNRPAQGSTVNSSDDIWYAVRTPSGDWSPTVRLSGEINSPYDEFSPSVDSDGNMYFCSNRPGGPGDMDVYFSAYAEGGYQAPVVLDDAINSQYHEGNVGVSPNGETLFIMVQDLPGGFGRDDIHYSVKIDGRWSKIKSIGPVINTITYDFSPKVSPDGKMLYFSSRISRDFVSPGAAYDYELFQRALNSPLNGFGNIYRISLDKLNLNDTKRMQSKAFSSHTH